MSYLKLLLAWFEPGPSGARGNCSTNCCSCFDLSHGRLVRLRPIQFLLTTRADTLTGICFSCRLFKWNMTCVYLIVYTTNIYQPPSFKILCKRHSLLLPSCKTTQLIVAQPQVKQLIFILVETKQLIVIWLKTTQLCCIPTTKFNSFVLW